MIWAAFPMFPQAGDSPRRIQTCSVTVKLWRVIEVFRLTILDIAAELGILEEITEEILEICKEEKDNEKHIKYSP